MTVPFSELKAVLIDLDGTLIDSMPLLYETYMDFLERNGYRGSHREFDSLIGAKIVDVVSTLAHKYEIRKPQQELVKLYMDLLHHHYTNSLELFPGAEQFIKFVVDKKLKLALVTAAPRSLVDCFLKGKPIPFDVIMTADNISRGKPSPEIYEKTLKELKLTPNEAIAIEDSHQGIQAALTAGIPIMVFQDSNDWSAILNQFKAHYE